MTTDQVINKVINTNSDIGITCGFCSSSFTGKALYHSEILKMFNSHKCGFKS